MHIHDVTTIVPVPYSYGFPDMSFLLCVVESITPVCPPACDSLNFSGASRSVTTSALAALALIAAVFLRN